MKKVICVFGDSVLWGWGLPFRIGWVNLFRNYIEDKSNFISEIKRILKPKGKVLLIDWSELSIMQAIAIVSKSKACEMFKDQGFVLDREIDAGDHHYGIIFKKI